MVEPLRVYALVSYSVQTVIELYATAEEADRELEEVRGDDPERAGTLGIEAIELEGGASDQSWFPPTVALSSYVPCRSLKPRPGLADTDRAKRSS
jgi:hypothetical protein